MVKKMHGKSAILIAMIFVLLESIIGASIEDNKMSLSPILSSSISKAQYATIQDALASNMAGPNNIKSLGSYDFGKFWSIIALDVTLEGDPGYTSLLCYDASTGNAKIYSKDIHIRMAKSLNLGKSWTKIVQGNFRGANLLFYDASTGNAEFANIDKQGNLDVVKSYNFGKSWSIIISGNFGGSGIGTGCDPDTDLLFLNHSTGHAKLYTIDFGEVCITGGGIIH